MNRPPHEGLQLFAAAAAASRALRDAFVRKPDYGFARQILFAYPAIFPVREESGELQHPDFKITNNRGQLLIALVRVRSADPPQRIERRANQAIDSFVRLVVGYEFDHQLG